MTESKAKLAWTFQNAVGAEAVLDVFDSIGADGLTLAAFDADLKRIRTTRLTVNIHSAGGDPMTALGIYSRLKEHPAHVTTSISLAASAASVIAMGGNTVTIQPHGSIFIHEAHMMFLPPSTAEDLRTAAKTVETISNLIAATYVEKAGGTLAEWRARMMAETWYDAREAVGVGLADAIAGDRLAPAASISRQFAAFAVQREVDRQMVPLLVARAVRSEIAARAAETTIRAAFASLPRRRPTRLRRPRRNIYGAYR